MVLPIYIYGQPVLRKEAEDIPTDYPELDTFLKDMWDTLAESEGIGLAAPQVGKAIRVVVIDLDVLSEDMPEYKDFRHAYINPHIVNMTTRKPALLKRVACRCQVSVKRWFVPPVFM